MNLNLRAKLVAVAAAVGVVITMAGMPANASVVSHHHRQPTYDCKVSHVDIFKVWTSNPGGPIAWHRHAVGELKCDTPPLRNCVRMSIQQFKKVDGIKQWVTVGRGRTNCAIPHPTKSYGLYMKCAQGRFRPEMKVTGRSSSGRVNNGVFFYGKRILRIANCTKPPGFP